MTIGSRRITVPVALLLAAGILSGCSQEEQKRKALASADSYAATGKNDEAIIEYRRAIQIDPKDGQARLRLARTFLKAGAAADGLREMLRAGDLLPQDVDVQITIGNLLLGTNRFEDARARADRILERQPQNVLAHILRANALAGLEDFDGALKDMESAVTADPADPIAYVGFGAVQRARGRLTEAEEAFRKAVSVQPDAPDIRLAYANFLIASGRNVDAERELKQAYALGAENVPVNRALTAFYAATGRPSDAETHLKKLAVIPESASWAGFALARFYGANGRHDDAKEVLNGLLQREDSALEAKVQLAALTYHRGERDAAHRLVDDVLKAVPKEPRALVLKAGFLLDEGKVEESVVLASAAAQNSRAAQPPFLLGLGYSRLGRLDDAKKAFIEALKREPRAIGAQVELSRLSLMTGDAVWAQRYGEQALRAAPQLPAAREAVVRAALARRDPQAAGPALAALRRDRPEDPEFLYLEGELRLLEGKRDAARQAFTKALSLEPRSVATVASLIRIDLSEGNVTGARSRAEKLLSALPKSYAALMLAARTYATSNDFARAEALLRLAINLDPANAEGYGTLASLYVTKGQLDAALQQFQDAAKRDPKSVAAHTMIGTVLFRLGRRSEAKDAYRHVLTIDREAPVAANNLAYLYAEDGEHLETAVQLAEIAKRRMPASPDPIDTLGWVYHKRKMPTYAISELENATARAPERASFRYHLGLAYASGGDAKAREVLESALALDPKSPLAGDARAALSSLKK